MLVLSTSLLLLPLLVGVLCLILVLLCNVLSRLAIILMGNGELVALL